MKAKQLTTLPMQSAAFNREGSGYAINWSPCGFTSVQHKDKYEAFEGWDD